MRRALDKRLKEFALFCLEKRWLEKDIVTLFKNMKGYDEENGGQLFLSSTDVRVRKSWLSLFKHLRESLESKGYLQIPGDRRQIGCLLNRKS